MKMLSRELKKKIEEFEDLRLEKYLIIEKKMLEALEAGRPVDPSLIDLSGMKERYLEALSVYGRFGLTPRELYEKRIVWLGRSGEEKMGPSRRRTVSMFLRRLYLAGLARREREGRTYHYFITSSGKDRLSYYKKKSETDEQKSWDRWLFDGFLLSGAMIRDIRDKYAFVGMLSPSLNPNFWSTYSFLWKKTEGLLDSILFLQLSILVSGQKSAVQFAIKESIRCLQELQNMQNDIIMAIAILKPSGSQNGSLS